jgi:predicted nicotinamide N-methyase
VLELGAGCGVVGITVAKRFPKANVLLTDLPEAEDIARCNISANVTQPKNKPSFANIEYQNLDWAEPLPKNLCNGDLDLVLVADCTYNPDVVPNLVRTLADVVIHNPDVVIVVAMKVRHDSEMVFFDLMKEKQIIVVDKLIVSIPLLGHGDEEIEVHLFKGS